MNARASTAYAGNALCAKMPVTLPEPMANRAQSVARSVVRRWLRGVIKQDEAGYAVIAGNGRTIVILHADGAPIASAVTRGPSVTNQIEALETLRDRGVSDYFAMTYRLPSDAAVALSGLFCSPTIREVFDAPGPQLKNMLQERIDETFKGSVLVRATDFAWAVLLMNQGAVIGCYGSDDRLLKSTIDDATALFYLDQVEVSVHPAFEMLELKEVLKIGATREFTLHQDAAIARTESAMIELLSELENGITRAEQETSNNAEILARILVQGYERTLALAGNGQKRLMGAAPEHPVLESHWDPERQQVDTVRLIETLQMAGIPEAWLAASDALILALERGVEQQLTWLSLADDMSSTALQETLADLLLQTRTLIRRWRVERRRVDFESFAGPVDASSCIPSMSESP